MERKKQLDMLHGPIWNKIPQFALPVAATAILEQLFNASDIAVVGNFTGAGRTIAVAAVGANSPLIGLIVNLFIGIAFGTNVVIAHAIGHGNKEDVRKAVHTSVLLALLGGMLVAVAGELIAAPVLGLLNVPEDVFPLALLYLRIYLAGMPVILLYNFEAAIFRSVGETKIPLMALLASGILNVILNLFFVAVLHMTVNGVAIATILFFGKSLLAIFNSDPEVVATGYIRLMMVVLSHSFSLLYDVMSGYLRGFGISLVPALLTMLGVCGIRIGWIQFVFPQSRTFQTIMTVYPFSLSATMLLIFIALLCYHPSKRFSALQKTGDAENAG